MSEEPESRPDVEAWLRERAAPRPAAAARYELLDGEQIALPARTEAHAGHVNRLTRFFTEAAGGSAVVSVQNPVWLDESSQPCPDLALLAPRDDAYTSSYPSPGDVLLVVEVTDSTFSLTHARGRKAAHYARSGIPECWVVDAMSKQVLVHRSPASGGYRDIRNLRGEAVLAVQALDGISVATAQLFGG